MAMREKLTKVTDEITRFLACAKAWNDREMAEELLKKKHDTRCYNTKEGGALRRASLDLSRALANMRKW
jgi:hypothetical protein